MEESALPRKSRSQQRVTAFRRLGGSLVVVLAVALTATLINSVYSVQRPVPAAPYDGITLYRGLFFASGPVASKIPTLSKTGSYFPAEYKSLEDQIIRYIQAKDPKFFESFAREIQSGDRVRVGQAIRSTNKLQKEALFEITKNSKTQFASQLRQSNAEPSPDAGKDLCTLLIAIVHFVFQVKPPIQELQGLTFERYVDEVVRAVPRV
jgi:SdpC family antimicrobial peptide